MLIPVIVAVAFQAVPISLADVVPTEESNKEASAFVQSKVAEKHLKAKVIKSDKYSAILDVFNTDGKSFSEVRIFAWHNRFKFVEILFVKARKTSKNFGFSERNKLS